MAEAIELSTVDLDWIDLEIAFRDSASGALSTLDLRSGEVIAVWGEHELFRLCESEPSRYLRIPSFGSRDARDILHDFVHQIASDKLRNQLSTYLRQPGGLSHVMQALEQDALLFDAYCRFEEAAVYERLSWWLAAQGVRARRAPPAGTPLQLLTGAAFDIAS